MTQLEAFKQRMQQYKLARALNPLLKYWDFKALSYAKGGVTDGVIVPPMAIPILAYNPRVYNELDSDDELLKLWNSSEAYENKLALPDFEYIRDFDKILQLLGRPKDQRIALIANSLQETGGGKRFELAEGSGRGVYLFTGDPTTNKRIIDLYKFVGNLEEYNRYAKVLEQMEGSSLLKDITNKIGLILYEDHTNRIGKKDGLNWCYQSRFNNFLDPNLSYKDKTKLFEEYWLRPEPGSGDKRLLYADYLDKILPETSEEYQQQISEEDQLPENFWNDTYLAFLPIGFNDTEVNAYYDGGVTGEPEQNSFNYQGLMPIKPSDNNTTNQQSDSDWSATDMVRLGSIAADIGAMFTPPGVSTGLSLASDLANLGADIADNRGFWNTAGTFGANLGLTALGALPIVSQYAHASRAVKGLTKVAPKISAAVAGLGAAGLVSNADEILKSFSKISSDSSLNKDDWRNIAVGVLLALGGGKAIKNASSSKRALNPLSVSTQNAAVLASLPEEVLRMKQTFNTPTNLSSPIQSNLLTNPLSIQFLEDLYKFPKRTLLEIKADYDSYGRATKRLINYLSLTGTPNDKWKLLLRKSPSAVSFKKDLSASLPYWQSPFVLQRAANAGFTNGLNALIKNVNEDKYNIMPSLSDFTAASISRVKHPIFNDYGIEGKQAQFEVNPIYYWLSPPSVRLSTVGHEMFHEMLNLVGDKTPYGDALKTLNFYDPSNAYRSDPDEIDAHISELLQHRWFKDGPFDLFPFENLDEMGKYAKWKMMDDFLPKIIKGLNDALKSNIFNFIKKHSFGIIPALGISGAASSLLSKDNDQPESYAYGTDEVGDENGQKQNKALNIVKNVLGFTPYLGDAISLYDAYKDVQNKDYLQAAIGAGLTLLPIPAAATKPIKKVAKKAAKEVARYIPTVNRKSVIELLNKLTGHDYAKMAKEGDINNMRNRSIERLYEPDVRARAELIKRLYDVDLLKTYDDILDQYTNEYHTLPQANLDPDLERNVAAQMTLTDLAREAFENNNSYIPKRGDYVLNVDNRSALPPQDIIDHEMTHYNLYMHLNSPNWGDSDLSRITNQFESKLNDVNPLDPANTSYFRNWMEQNAYGISVYNALKEQGIKPTKGAVKKYINSLPDTDPVKKAAFLFKTIDDYYNWLMAMPLADNNKETENTYLA